jgi:hypothetical protein
MPAVAAPPGPQVRVEMRVTGPVVTSTRFRSGACDDQDAPDVPARAYRESTGKVTLIASHDRNRRLRGDSLLALRRDCQVVLEGHNDSRPEHYDGQLWIASTWTPDGRTVHALIHSEYHGNHFPGGCHSNRLTDCWYNAITQAESHDGGGSFQFERQPRPVVAAVPYRYDPDSRRQTGFFNPTNILHHDNAWYVMAFTEGAGAQKRGNCLLRTDNIADPTAWRAWDGTGFKVRLVDPYSMPLPDPKAHLCQPLVFGAVNEPISSLARDVRTGTFLALTVGDLPPASPTDRPRKAIMVSASRDLVTWSSPAFVRAIATPAAHDCRGEAPVAYPSLLDPNSTDRNFETVGATAMIFLTRFNLHPTTTGCSFDMDRDLIFVPVRIGIE